jgi:hypothetical protein
VTEPPTDPDAGGGPAARIRPFLDAPSVAGGDPLSGSESGPRALRPYVLTSGRVSGDDPQIGLETQVSARTRTSLLPSPRLSTELRDIVDLCRQPLSVAEISARLRLHLGVAKILVGDLRAAGYLDVHLVDVANAQDPDTILRVMRGLRAIS